MSCEEIQQSLSLYVDDALMLPIRVAVDEHVDKCPVCRDELFQLRALTRGLSMLSKPQPPVELAASVTNALMIEAAARRQSPKASLAIGSLRFLEPRLMPYSVGSVASVILFVAMFAALRPHFEALHEAAARVPQSIWFPRVPATILTSLCDPRITLPVVLLLPSSPSSLNPRGALPLSPVHMSTPQTADIRMRTTCLSLRMSLATAPPRW